MINKQKILRLAFQLSFYSYFIVWSLTSFYTHPDYKTYSPQENASYIFPSQINSALFSLNTENKRSKYSEESSVKPYYTGKFLISFPFQTFKLTGSFHFIHPGEVPVIINVYSLIDHPRPPPFNS